MLGVRLHLTAQMNFLKRATTSILRRPGKSIILLLLVFILGTVIAGAISVEGAISNTDANLRANMPPIVTIGHEDWQIVDEEMATWTDEVVEEFWSTPQILTPELVRTIGDLPYVNYYDYVMQTQLNSLDLIRYEGEHTGTWSDSDWATHFNLVGGSRSEIVHIEQGIIELVIGRTFDESELLPNINENRSAAIVSDVWANSNNLSVGDTFSLYTWVPYPTEDGWSSTWPPAEEEIYATIAMEFYIVGVFAVAGEMIENPQTNEEWQLQLNQQESLNRIYVPNWAIESVFVRQHEAHLSSWEAVDFENPWTVEDEDEQTIQMHIVPLFVLNDAREIDAFREAGTDLLPRFRVFEDLSSTFDDIASSMDTMQNIANWILYASVIATLLILSLLITLFLRDRRYEMGVYLALGERKGRIISQILMEVVVTAFVGITLAVFTGNIISNHMSRSMLRNELASQQNQDDPWGGGGRWTEFDQIGIPTTSMSPEEMMEAFEVSLSMETIGLFYAVGLGAVVLSTMVPVIYVVTLNPKKVLM